MEFLGFLEKQLREGIVIYEGLCNESQAQSDEAKRNLDLITISFKELGLEFCSHNAAFYGFKRYEKYYNKTLNRPITRREYKLLNDDQKMNFETLNEFPFKI